MRRYVKAKRVAVAGEHDTSHAYHATALWYLGMVVIHLAHWLRLQGIEQGKAVMLGALPPARSTNRQAARPA